jgi:hypothetical protein
MDLKAKIMNVFWGRNIATEKSWDELADCIVDVCREHIHDEQAWWLNENQLVRDALEETLLDLELEKHTLVKFPTPGKQMKDHRWRNLK